jgi:predicted HicB family RNase H-like nuclease
MPYSEAQKKATLKYRENAYKRVPFDIPKDFYEQVKVAAQSQGKSINGFIKEALEEKMSRANDDPVL